MAYRNASEHGPNHGLCQLICAYHLVTLHPSQKSAALTALVRYEQNHKDRAGAVTAIENRLAALVERDLSRN